MCSAVRQGQHITLPAITSIATTLGAKKISDKAWQLCPLIPHDASPSATPLPCAPATGFWMIIACWLSPHAAPLWQSALRQCARVAGIQEYCGHCVWRQHVHLSYAGGLGDAVGRLMHVVAVNAAVLSGFPNSCLRNARKTTNIYFFSTFPDLLKFAGIFAQPAIGTASRRYYCTHSIGGGCARQCASDGVGREGLTLAH